METAESIKTKIETLLEKIRVHNSEVGNYTSHILLSDRKTTYLVKLDNGEIKIFETELVTQENLIEDAIKGLAKKFGGKRNVKRLDSTFLDGPAKSLPIIYAILVFCGALYFKIYFGAFNINIFKYLDLSEILVSFLNVIIPTLIAFSLLLIQIIIAGYVSDRKGFSKYHDYKNLWLSIGVAIAAIYVGVVLNIRVEDYKTFGYTVSLSLIMLYYLVCIFHEFLLQTDDSIKNTSLYLMSALVVCTSYNALHDIDTTVNPTKYEPSKILMKDSTIITTDSFYYYIGRTNKYIFLYNSRDNHRDLISVDGIKRISFCPKK